MNEPIQTGGDVKALAEAFEAFTKTTHTLEEAYARLEARLHELDQELAAKNRELALTSDYLNYILESMSDGVVAVDTEGVVTAFNRAAADVLGYPAEEVIGQRFSKVFRRPFSVSIGPDAMELRAKDGTGMPVSERDSPIADRSGNRIGTVKVFQDLSEIEALREQVRRMDRLAAIGEMAATVAHEIRNPLGGIRGFATLLAQDVPPDDARWRLVQKILAGTKSLDRVVNELLEYTRPLDIRLVSVGCSEVAQAAIGLMETDGNPVTIVNDISPTLQVLADPDKMRQVLLNILLNAAQSITGEGEVRLSAATDGDAVTIAVCDTGRGMSADELSKAFVPFFTTREKGTGLGLAVAAKIVDGHGGNLSAESRPGEGTTVRIQLQKAGTKSE